MNQRNRFPARRRFLKQSAALSAGASLAAPAVLAQVHQPAIKLGLLHPVSGPDAALGRACREAALLALHDVNARRNTQGLPPLLAVCADVALHAQPLAAARAMRAQGVEVMLALLTEGAVLPAAATQASLAVLRLAPAALAQEASGGCAALLQSLPATAQLAVASSDAAVRALDAVLDGVRDGERDGVSDGERNGAPDGRRACDLEHALCKAGLAAPLVVTAGAAAARAEQAVLLVPAAAASSQAAQVRRA